MLIEKALRFQKPSKKLFGSSLQRRLWSKPTLITAFISTAELRNTLHDIIQEKSPQSVSSLDFCSGRTKAAYVFIL